VPAALRAKALQAARSALDTAPRWTKVHAAEALLVSGDDTLRDVVARAFRRELDASGAVPQYRIGIWRVLAQAAADGDRGVWIRKIVDAFLDAGGPDRLHASETLGKLAYHAPTNELAAFEAAARGSDGPLAANALWVLANSGRPDAEQRLGELLTSADPATQATAAYAVRYLPAPSSSTVAALLAAVAGSASAAPIVRASLAAAAFVHTTDRQRDGFRGGLQIFVRRGDADVKSEACGAYAMAGEAQDIATVAPLVDDPNGDARMAAAAAVLQIDRR